MNDAESPAPVVVVGFQPATQRYEITVDGDLAGYACFTFLNGVYTFDHTVIDPTFRGRGLAGQLIEGAVSDVVGKGGKFAATCEYAQRWLQRHHDYDDALVAPPT